MLHRANEEKLGSLYSGLAAKRAHSQAPARHACVLSQTASIRSCRHNHSTCNGRTSSMISIVINRRRSTQSECLGFACPGRSSEDLRTGYATSPGRSSEDLRTREDQSYSSQFVGRLKDKSGPTTIGGNSKQSNSRGRGEHPTVTSLAERHEE